MKKKYGIVCSSTAYFKSEDIEKYNIGVVDLSVIYDGNVFNETGGITIEDVYAALDSGKNVTTTQPTPSQFLECFDKFDAIYENIICLCMSSKLSGTYNSAQIAANEFEGNATITVIDTKSASVGMYPYLDAVVDNYDCSLDEMKEVFARLHKHNKTFLSIFDITTLYQTGRMSMSKAFVSNLLKIKPLLALDDEGAIYIESKIRTSKKLIIELVNKVKELAPKKIYVTSVVTTELADEFVSLVKEKIENIEITICKEVGPVLALHLGRGGVGVCFSEGTKK